MLFDDIGLLAPEILLPRKGVDLTKWAVVACDQYTSQPEYWERVKECSSRYRASRPCFFSRSRISPSRTTSAGGGASAAGGGGVFSLLIALIAMKIAKAMIRKSMTV